MSNARRPRTVAAAIEPAYWNGLKTFARRGSAVVADAGVFPEYWARKEGLIGKRIAVVLVVLNGVNVGGGTVYLDDRDGSGWRKVTVGHGGPTHRHAEVEIEEDSFRPHNRLGAIGGQRPSTRRRRKAAKRARWVVELRDTWVRRRQAQELGMDPELLEAALNATSIDDGRTADHKPGRYA